MLKSSVFVQCSLFKEGRQEFDVGLIVTFKQRLEKILLFLKAQCNRSTANCMQICLSKWPNAASLPRT